MTSYEELYELAMEDRLQLNALTAIESAKQLTKKLDEQTRAEMRSVLVAVSAHVLAACILHTAKQIVIKKVPLE